MMLLSTFFLRIGFQPSLSPNMDAIVEFHDYILCFLTSILFFVLAIFFQIVKHSFYKLSYPETLEDIYLRKSIFKARVLKHNRFLETIWTLLPMMILVFIAIPSYSLLYTTDGVYSPSITIKVIGQQWFWTYSYSDKKMGVQKKDYLHMDLSSYSLLIKNILFDEDSDPVILKRNKKGKLSSVIVDPEKMGAFMKKLHSYGFLTYADNTRRPFNSDLVMNRPMFDLYYLNFKLFENLSNAFEAETINELNNNCPIDKTDFISYVKENPHKFIIYVKPLFDLVIAHYCATTLIKIWALSDRIQDLDMDCILMNLKEYRPLPVSSFPDYRLRPSCSPSYVLPIHLAPYSGEEALEKLSRRLKPLPTPMDYKIAKILGRPSPFPYWLYEVISIKSLQRRDLSQILKFFSQFTTELSFIKYDIQEKIKKLQIVSIKVPVIVDVYARVPLTYDSYMVPTSELKVGQPRLLTVDKPLVLPVNTNIRILVSSYDVLHSFAVPSLGIKMDAVPGRLNQIGTRILHESVLRGQCSELCGVNHGFMPIEIIGVKVDKFLEWYLHKLSSNKDLFHDFSKSSDLIKMASTDNVTSLQNHIITTSFVKVAYRDFLKLCLNSESTLTLIFKNIYGTDFLGVKRAMTLIAFKYADATISRWQAISRFAASTGLKDFLVGPHFDPKKHTSRFAIVHHVDVNNNYQSHLFVFDRMDPDRSFKIYPRVMTSLFDKDDPSPRPKIRSDVLSLFNKKVEKANAQEVYPDPDKDKGIKLKLLFYPNKRKFELVFRYPALKNHFIPEEFFITVTIPHMGGTYVFSSWAEILDFLRSLTYSVGMRIWSPDNASRFSYPFAFYEFEYAIKHIFNLIDPDDPNIDLIDWMTPNTAVFLRKHFPEIFDKVVRNITISSPVDDGFDIQKLLRYFHLKQIRAAGNDRRLRLEREEIPLRALKGLGEEMKDMTDPRMQRIHSHLEKTVRKLEWYKY